MRFLIIIISLFFSGCSVINIFETQAGYAKKYLASDLKSGIDGEILIEKSGGRPQSLIDPDSPDAWSVYWKRRVEQFRTNTLSEIKGYRGPTGDWFADYIISERRKNNLPEIKTNEPNQ
jgi:hypothetical protein